MEPKSIAFYTAVAVSILAVISATTFPSLALAQPDGQGQPTHATDSTNTVDKNDPKADDSTNTVDKNDPKADDSTNTVDKNDPKADDSANTDETDPKADSAESNDNSDEGGATENNGAGRQSLGLDPSSGVASCGQVVTEDTILTSDLECGLGGIEGFDAGVRFVGSSGGEVSDVAFTNNNVGIVMSGAEGIEISRNTMTQNGFAIVSASSSEATIAFNSAVANELQGIVLTGSDDNVIAANSLYGNGDNGIYVDIMSTRNTIDFNTAYGHETADLNNADGQPTSVNGNTYGEHNNCGISLPAGLCG